MINELLRPLDNIPIAVDVRRNFSRRYAPAASKRRLKVWLALNLPGSGISPGISRILVKSEFICSRGGNTEVVVAKYWRKHITYVHYWNANSSHYTMILISRIHKHFAKPLVIRIRIHSSARNYVRETWKWNKKKKLLIVLYLFIFFLTEQTARRLLKDLELE